MDQFNNVTVKKLSNGLTLVTVPMPGVASVAAAALVGVGSRYENEQNMGLAHFYEHLSVMGTEKYPTNLDLTMQIEKVGADFNAFTGEEFTAFYVKTEGRQLPMALDVLSQLVVHPLLKASEIERERLVICEEINMREDTPQIKVGDRMMELLFSGHGLGLPGAGTKETVANLRQKDFFELKKRHYVGKNMVVVVAGSAKKKVGLRDEVEKYFGKLATGQETHPESYIERVYPSDTRDKPSKKAETNTAAPRIEVIHRQTDQVHLAMGFRGFSRQDEQRYAQSLLSVILGSGFTSRLFQKVRQERSLAYSVGTDSDLFIDTGMLSVDAGVDKKRTEEAIKVIWGELNKVQSSKITEAELRKAKDYLRGKMVLRLEEPLNLGLYYAGQQLLDKEILTLEQVLAKVEAVTIEEIEQVVRTIFRPERMSLVVIGSSELGLNVSKLRKMLTG